MSIYAALWKLKFPKDGDDFMGCDWIEVIAQIIHPDGSTEIIRHDEHSLRVRRGKGEQRE